MKNIIFLTLLLALTACSKKTQVKGIVYSKNKIPVSTATISCVEDFGSSARDWKAANTNNKGEYEFSFYGKRKYKYSLVCKSDSGNTSVKLNVGTTNNIDIYLGQ